MLKILVAEVMIYGEGFTQWTKTAYVEMRITIDWWQFSRRKDLRKVVYRKEGVSQGKVRRKEKQVGWKYLQSLRVLWLVRTYAPTATESGHILHQGRPSTAISNN